MAALVLSLAEQGRLRLDDRLSRWLPTYPNARNVTLRQLLSHTSGLFNVDENESYVEAVDRALGRDWTPAQVLRYVRRPYFAPGEGWHYSDTNYVLLGLVIKRASGTTVAAEMHRRVLDPHGLEDVVLQPDEPAPPGSARGYGTQGPPIPRPGRYVSYPSIASSEWTAAGMVATAPALARWGQALFTGRVVTRESLDQMLDFVPADMIGYTGYGLGIGQRRIVERDVHGATGTHPGFASELWHDPTQRATVAVLWNDPTILHGPRSPTRCSSSSARIAVTAEQERRSEPRSTASLSDAAPCREPPRQPAPLLRGGGRPNDRRVAGVSGPGCSRG